MADRAVETLTVDTTDGYTVTVRYKDDPIPYVAHKLGFDECLGLCAAVLMREPRPALHWLKTPAQQALMDENRERNMHRRDALAERGEEDAF